VPLLKEQLTLLVTSGVFVKGLVLKSHEQVEKNGGRR